MSPAAPVPASLPPPGKVLLEGLRVLIVEDDPADCEFLTQLLQRQGLQPESAPEATAALTKLHAAASAGQPFHVALIDATLPAIDGWTLITWIKTDPRLVGATILLRSAADPLPAASPAPAADVICLDKPLSESALLATLQTAYCLLSAPVPACDLAEALARCGGVQEVFLEMARFFLQQSPELLARIRQGLAQNDAKEVAAAAHRLRGTAIYLGAPRTVAAAEQVEQAGQARDLTRAAEATPRLESECATLRQAMASYGETGPAAAT